ncbi:hypothetical protein [Desulfonema magnum]|uniref:Uncharacterized protein n=1 Tax=Desulfonema magnum TaxID=45655 RepID=A0A975BZ25_9BACT|nr:hypothetical protein [Desulfonema magnum]QTA93977.1 Uncharacterized protein dnm_100870 [Desulfonema magnum]
MYQAKVADPSETFTGGDPKTSGLTKGATCHNCQGNRYDYKYQIMTSAPTVTGTCNRSTESDKK